MSRMRILPLTLTILTLGSVGAAAAPHPHQAVRAEAMEAKKVTAAEAEDADKRATRPTYGPIHAKDPMVRAEIKRLYLERNQVVDDTRAQLAQLGEAFQAETDPDFRFEISREIAQLKIDLELRSMELGLAIATLNGDTGRVAEFDKALDQLRNPEKYRPAPVDPSVQQERIRAMGLDRGGVR